ncbi:DUF6978 family protein [Oceanobacillus kimchii]|uniref:DUF6978 family protein n=1 Tax=Oceanobacillus kimchii TaxID=746691 RepID=UPI003C7710B0
MEQSLIDELIQSLKRIIDKKDLIRLPEAGFYEKLNLKSTDYSFIIDINRKGRKKPKFTLQLRNNNSKDAPLIRLDLLGPPHSNPPGDFSFSGELIPCPHIHIANSEYGLKIAYPLNNKYAKMFLTENEQDDLVLVLKNFLSRCNVANVNDFEYLYQTELI